MAADGRFLAAVCREVVELGPIGASIHAIDEHVKLADVAPLSAIYSERWNSCWLGLVLTPATPP